MSTSDPRFAPGAAGTYPEERKDDGSGGGTAQRAGDYAKASELQYGRLPQIEQEIKAGETRLSELQKGQRMLKEEVDEEDIAEVVSKWTHIPVSRLMEGEVQKLIHMEDRLHLRVIGQDEAIRAVANAIRRARAASLRSPRRASLRFPTENSPKPTRRSSRASRATVRPTTRSGPCCACPSWRRR